MYVLYGKVTQAKRWQKCQTFWYFVLSLFYSVYTMVHNAIHKEKSSTNTTGTFIVCTFFFVFPSGICAMWIIVVCQLNWSYRCQANQYYIRT